MNETKGGIQRHEGQNTPPAKKKRWENLTFTCQRLWLLHGLFSCELGWGEEQGQNCLGGGVGILKPECIYRLTHPNDLLPLLHQQLLSVAWTRVRFYFASATALDAIFRTGKGFCFQFQADGVGGRRRKGQEEKGSHEMNSEIMCRVLYSSVFSKCVHSLWYSHEKCLIKRCGLTWCNRAPGLWLTPPDKVLSVIVLGIMDSWKKNARSVVLRDGLMESFSLLTRDGAQAPKSGTWDGWVGLEMW